MRALGAGGLLLLAACGSGPAVDTSHLTPEERHLLRPVPEAPDSAQRQVARGDEMFVRATTAAPESAAIDLYTRARACYVEAQAECGLMVPPAITERSRECLMRVVALQKQRRSAPK